MVRSSKYFEANTIAQLQRLALRTRKPADGLAAGVHRSRRRGFSVEFAEHREYAPGDDLRYLDWKALGRTDRYYLKQFDDETNLSIHFVLDNSPSMMYRGTKGTRSKFEHAAALSVTLATSVLSRRDAVSYSDTAGIATPLPMRSGPDQVDSILSWLEKVEKGGAAQLDNSLVSVAQNLRRHSLVIIASDFFENLEGWRSKVVGLSQRHSVALWHVLDEDELHFPFNEETRFNDLESNQFLEVDSRQIRDAYLAEIAKLIASVQEFSRQSDIDYLLVNTSETLLSPLARFLHR